MASDNPGTVQTEDLSIGRFLVSQSLITDPKEVRTDYDLIICAVSWESRNCHALNFIGGSKIKAFVLRFNSSGTSEATIRKNKNLSFLVELCPNSEVIELGKSIDIEDNLTELEKRIKDEFCAVKRPLKVLIDVTNIPKSYLCFITGTGFCNDYFCKMDCLYSEGAYDLSSSDTFSGPKSIISCGDWQAFQIPYLQSSDTFPDSKDLLVVLGGEISFTLPFIYKEEPCRLSVVFISGGIPPESFNRAEKNAYYEISNASGLIRKELPIYDVVGVLRHSHEFCDYSKSTCISGYAIGSKPQSLALALASIDQAKMEVICRIPNSYTPNEVTSSGKIYYYQIEDRFEPTSYL